jgi:hypothetical protein
MLPLLIVGVKTPIVFLCLVLAICAALLQALRLALVLVLFPGESLVNTLLHRAHIPGFKLFGKCL